jgi:hypothetical protein
MDVLFAWLVERLGPIAVNRTAKVVALLCGIATVACAIALILFLTRG